jgi:hypothetical protein
MKCKSRRLRLERLESRTVPSAPGDFDWLRQFGSVVGRDDDAPAVDAHGNLYVAGYVNGALPGQISVGGADAYLRKYDAAGNELWTRQFGSVPEPAIFERRFQFSS